MKFIGIKILSILIIIGTQVFFACVPSVKKENVKYRLIHNNDGTFYDRHLVFPNLGFDRFIPICSKLMHRGEQCYWNNYLLHCVWRFNVSGRLVFWNEGCQGE